MVYSPPPSPMSTTPTSITSMTMTSNNPSINISVATKYLDPGERGAQDVCMVLSPVPPGGHSYSDHRNASPRNPSPAESTKTLVNEGSVPEINIVPGHHFASNLGDFAERSRATGPGLKRVGGGTILAMSSLSLPPDSVVQRSPRMSGAKADAELRSKTDNLERMITEVEKLSGSDSGSNGIGSGREVKKYIRRRYTDSRHPTTELPDVRDGVSDLPSVRDPPIRNKSKSKEVLEDVNNDEELKRSPNIADRPSYKRWQQTQS